MGTTGRSEGPAATIQPEAPVDRAAIDSLVVTAFPTPAEAALVHHLRARGELLTSLVAEIDHAVVGHVAFSPVVIDGAPMPASGLGPIAVAPAYRRRGIAADLVRAGLEARRAAGDALVVVLGDPAYYGRFGFRPAASPGLVDTYGGGDAFQALELAAGSAPSTLSTVRYSAAFDEVPAHPVEPGAREDLALVLAAAASGAIGKEGGLPWDLPADRAHFERLTRGHVVIMGRGTWEETGRPLPGRDNVVVSRHAHGLDGATVVPSLDEALRVARRLDPLPFVIGGRRLFEDALPGATRVYLTEVPGAPAADVFVLLDRSGLTEVASWDGPDGERYVILERPPGRPRIDPHRTPV